MGKVANLESVLLNVPKCVIPIVLCIMICSMGGISKPLNHNQQKADVVGMIKKSLAAGQNSCASIAPVYDHKGLTVLDFGATPNDGTDDSQAFQKMLDSNHDLVIPAGTYNINSSVIVKLKNNLQIFGLGNVNLISGDQVGTGVFKFVSSTGVLISNINFIGNSNVQDSHNVALTFADKDNTFIGIFNCKFTGSAAGGFNMAIDFHLGGGAVEVSGCTFDSLFGNKSGNGYGILLAHISNVKICGNNFTGSPGRGRHAVYLSTGAQNVLVVNNTVKNFDCASINFNCYSHQEFNKNNVIKHNTIIGGARGYVAGNWDVGQINIVGKCWNNTIDSNRLINSTRMGIYVGGSSGPNFHVENIGSGTIISNNIIQNCGAVGVMINGANNVQIIKNKIDNAGMSDQRGSGFSAIKVTSNLDDKTLPTSHDIFIKGNVVSGSSVTRSSLSIEKSVYQPYNITVDKSNVFPKLRISDVE